MFTIEHFHPMIVHFPVALIIISLLFEIFILAKRKDGLFVTIGFWLQAIAALAAVFAYLTGEFFTREFTGPAAEIKETHELFAHMCTWTLVGVVAIRAWMMITKKEVPFFKWLVFIGLIFSAVCVGFCGFWGGTLVYNFMIK